MVAFGLLIKICFPKVVIQEHRLETEVSELTGEALNTKAAEEPIDEIAEEADNQGNAKKSENSE